MKFTGTERVECVARFVCDHLDFSTLSDVNSLRIWKDFCPQLSRSKNETEEGKMRRRECGISGEDDGGSKVRVERRAGCQSVSSPEDSFTIEKQIELSSLISYSVAGYIMILKQHPQVISSTALAESEVTILTFSLNYFVSGCVSRHLLHIRKVTRFLSIRLKCAVAPV